MNLVSGTITGVIQGGKGIFVDFPELGKEHRYCFGCVRETNIPETVKRKAATCGLQLDSVTEATRNLHEFQQRHGRIAAGMEICCDRSQLQPAGSGYFILELYLD
jgi:hypothetical protein